MNKKALFLGCLSLSSVSMAYGALLSTTVTNSFDPKAVTSDVQDVDVSQEGTVLLSKIDKGPKGEMVFSSLSEIEELPVSGKAESYQVKDLPEQPILLGAHVRYQIKTPYEKTLTFRTVKCQGNLLNPAGINELKVEIMNTPLTPRTPDGVGCRVECNTKLVDFRLSVTNINIPHNRLVDGRKIDLEESSVHLYDAEGEVPLEHRFYIDDSFVKMAGLPKLDKQDSNQDTALTTSILAAKFKNSKMVSILRPSSWMPREVQAAIKYKVQRKGQSNPEIKTITCGDKVRDIFGVQGIHVIIEQTNEMPLSDLKCKVDTILPIPSQSTVTDDF